MQAVLNADATRTGSRSIRWTMQRFTDLKVWQLAHRWVLDVYRLSSRFPDYERFGIVSQLRRAASAVPANIAEGSKRRTAADYARFLNIAESSLSEAEYHLILARDLGFAPAEAFASLLATADEVSRMLCGLRVKVQSRA